MLRSTGFFRGIDCPFYTEGYNGRTDRDVCNRPYCHFRHPKLNRLSSGVNCNRISKEFCAKQNDLVYDPCNPEVGRPAEQRNGEPELGLSKSGPLDQGALELEMVNRAIEAVRSEVEREQKKLSLIEDQEYNPTTRDAAKRPKLPAAAPPLEYDPGSHQMSQTVDYNPTPRSSKYTLDCESLGSSASALEYVPTAISKTAIKKPALPKRTIHSPSPPSSPPSIPAKTSYLYSSSRSKYTLDNSKPPTDMEYDPLSNYSSRPGAKSSMGTAERRAAAGNAGFRKRPLSLGISGKQTVEEGYVPAVKKPKHQAAATEADSQKYIACFSESDEESSGTEYRPTSMNRLQQRKAAGGFGKGGESTGSAVMARRVSSDMDDDELEQYDSEGSNSSGPGSLDSQTASKQTAAKSSEKASGLGKEASSKSSSHKEKEKKGREQKKSDSSKASSKNESKQLIKDESKKSRKDESRKPSMDESKKPIKEESKKSSKDEAMKSGKDGLKKPSKVELKKSCKDESKKSSKDQSKKSSKDESKKSCKDASKKSSMDESKKSSQTEGRTAEGRNQLKEKIIDKNISKDGRNVKIDSTKDSKSWKTDRLQGESRSGLREKGGDSSSLNKTKSSDRHRGRDSSKPRQPENGGTGNRAEEKGKKYGGPDRHEKGTDYRKRSGGVSEGKVKMLESRQRSLTHVDLFGDESAEEEEEEEVDEEGQETVVRKSAAAFRRGSFTKSKRKGLSSSSSEESDNDDVEDHDDDDDDGNTDADYTDLPLDLDYEEDPMEECLRIFNESKDVKTEAKGRQAKQASKESEVDSGAEITLTTLLPGQKKRVSHFTTKGNVETPPKPVVRPYRPPTAQEICYQRMQMAQQQAAELAAKTNTATATPTSGYPGQRKRIAHRPNQSAPAAKSSYTDMTQTSSHVTPASRLAPGQPSVKMHTSAGILSKTTSTVAQKRVAHTPTMKSSTMKRPIIPTEFGAKVPTNIRQRYLNIFIDECLKFCPSEETAFELALQEEKVVYDRSSSKNIYLNVAVNTLKKLRSKSGFHASPAATCPAVSTNRKAQSHEEVLGGRLAAKTSFSINRASKPLEGKLTGASLYRKLREYLMSEEQLEEHGYPRPHPTRPGRAVVHNLPEKKNTDPFTRICCRCGAEYKVSANGNCVRREECSHHWGRLRRCRVPGGWETQYSCCSGSVGSPGCQVAKQHVQDGRKEALESFVQTFEKPLPADGDAGVYALDCEMCYTKQGLELTRVTVINSELRVVYDTFVKPESKVVDYNTRFSGVTAEDLENTTISLRDIQAVLLSMFSADSILIGHSLESDLFALKLIHSTVVDTAIVFPHRLGLPYKRALRNLMADYLKRIIQDNVEGHDSSEDASACMQLMIWKIREDSKVKR
ncbi:hypothetical protein GJAV_G00088870 [Gymnothorax javanicus]|nr:hypothetical protein GJAV_G00088870 [Gymnothorax javanicus]